MKKLAKCGIHSLSFCNTKHDAPQCQECILVKHRPNLYKFVNGHKLKRCPHCGKYKMLHEYTPNTKGHRSWCDSCHQTYAALRNQINDKSFVIVYKIERKKEFIQFDTLSKTMKFVRQTLNDNENAHIEIKRIK